MVVQQLDINDHVNHRSKHPYISFICNTGPFEPSSVMQIGQAVRLTSLELYFNRLNMMLLTTTGLWTELWATERLDRLAFAP